MSITLKSGKLPFNRTLSDRLITRAIGCPSKDKATHVSVWEKIKDWFCGTNSEEALKRIYDLTHDDPSDHETNKTRSALRKVAAFYQLKHMAYPSYQGRFQASITKLPTGGHAFSFSIEGAISEQTLEYGDIQEEIDSVDQQSLSNNSQILDKDLVKKQGINAALDQVKYDGDKDEFRGVGTENKKRLNTNLLNPETKRELADRPALARKWIETQLKLFDRYIELRAALESTESLQMMDIPGTDDQWVYDFSLSLDSIKKETMREIAANLNNAYSATCRSFAAAIDAPS